MLKKTVTYEDYNGNTRTEDLYFNISKSEATKLEVSDPEGFSSYMQKVVAEGDNMKIFDIFVNFIKLAYGEKSEDGRRFIKSEELSNEFVQTAAYDALFDELTSNQKAIEAFVTGIMPKVDTDVPVPDRPMVAI